MTASALPLGTKREQGAVVFIQAGLGGSLIFASPGPNGINDSPLKLEQGPPVSSVSIGIHPYRGIVSLNTRRGSRSRGSFATPNGSCVLSSRSCRHTPRQLLTISSSRRQIPRSCGSESVQVQAQTRCNRLASRSAIVAWLRLSNKASSKLSLPSQVIGNFLATQHYLT